MLVILKLVFETVQRDFETFIAYPKQDKHFNLS